MKTDCWTAVRVALALGLFAALSAAQTAQPTVTVEQGDLFGEAVTFQETDFIGVTKTINVFRGIPFAEAPVGELRFQPPVAKRPWDGAYNATYFRDACIQNPAELYGLPMSEDCLNLNVYAPSTEQPEGAAVMLWIPGGGFVSGSGSLEIYNGLPLAASGDVIVVTINYRLNAFGFLTTKDEALPGNVGLMDQVLAMKWVKQNIAAFGGNPDKITLFGESAGSTSIGFHLLSEQSKDLFNQVIMQSGTVFSPWATFYSQEYLRQQTFDGGEKLGCNQQDSYALLNCMRTKNASDLYAAFPVETLRAAVVVDGTFLTDTAENLYASGSYSRVPILLGSTADEGTLFVSLNPMYAAYFTSETAPFISKEDFEKLVTEDILYYFGGPENNQLLDVVKMRYVDWSKADYPDADYFRAYVDYATDVQFACGSDYVARTHQKAGDDVFLYQMTQVPGISLLAISGVGPGWLGAGHGEDLMYAFGVPFMSTFSYIAPSISDEEKQFSVKFMEFWTNFAKAGNPSGSEDESDEEYWPRYTVPELGYKVLNASLPTSRALKSDMCYFWNTYVEQIIVMLYSLDNAEREWRQSFYNWKYNDMEEWREQFAQYKATIMN